MNEVYGGARNGWLLFGVAALHVLAVLALLSLKPVADAVGLAEPILVSLISDEVPQSQAVASLPRPLSPVAPTPLSPPPPPNLVAETPASPPAPFMEPPPVAEAILQTLSTPAPAVLAASSAPLVQAPTSSPIVPPPLIPPRFDAAYLDNPAPRYPALSRRRQEEGRVLLRVHVSPEGVASQVEIRESSGFERLDHAAREAVLRWHFVPARQGDQAVAGWVLVPISFSIRS
ncbi:MAG: energy transducer TonB [Pseudomonadota bacterium]